MDYELVQTLLLALIVCAELSRAVGDLGSAVWQRRLRPVRNAARWVRAQLRRENKQQECDQCRR